MNSEPPTDQDRANIARVKAHIKEQQDRPPEDPPPSPTRIETVDQTTAIEMMKEYCDQGTTPERAAELKPLVLDALDPVPKPREPGED